MRRWRLALAGLAIAGLAIVVAALLLLPSRYGRTEPFKDATGAAVPGSVAEMRRLRLGGVEQWVVVRGRDRRAPILIWLHGGPGTEELGLLRYFNAALEDHFLVVYWTQRGTGRSYSPAIPTASMTPARFVADLDELVDWLRQRFGARKVVLVGHSWGTAIGVLYAQAHPDKVAAYVGIGQIVNEAEGERRSFAFTLAAARRAGDASAIAELTSLGAPPFGPAGTAVERRWLDRFGGAWHRPTPLRELVWKSVQAPEAGWQDLLNYQRGIEFSFGALWPQMLRLDFIRSATRFAMPVFILAGRHDHNVDGALAHDYFDAIEAPAKQFRWFENSAHSPPFEEPDAFNDYMIGTVLPAVKRLDTRM